MHLCYTGAIMMQKKLNLKKLPYVWQVLLEISISHFEAVLHKYSIFSEVKGTALKSNVILLALSILTAVLLKTRPFIKAIRSNLALVTVLLELYTLLHLFSEKYNSVSKGRNSGSKQKKKYEQLMFEVSNFWFSSKSFFVSNSNKYWEIEENHWF